jgi:hypothetical protein
MQDKINLYKHNWQVKGQFVLELFHNTDHTLESSAAFSFFQLSFSFTDWVITKILEAKYFLESKHVLS